MKRHKIVRVSDKVLASWIEDILPDLPDDFIVIGARWDKRKGNCDFLVEAEDFPDVTDTSEMEVIEY